MPASKSGPSRGCLRCRSCLSFAPGGTLIGSGFFALTESRFQLLMAMIAIVKSTNSFSLNCLLRSSEASRTFMGSKELRNESHNCLVG